MEQEKLAGKQIVMRALESPEQAMQIVEGYIGLVNEVKIACELTVALLESGKTESAKTALKIMGENIIGMSVGILARATTNAVPVEDIEKILKEQGITEGNRPNTRMTGNA